MYSLNYQKSEQNNLAAEALIKSHEQYHASLAKKETIGAIVALVLLIGSLVAGRYAYIEFIGGLRISVGCFGGLLFGFAVANLCVSSVINYLKAKRAREEFSKNPHEMRAFFKNRLIEDLNSRVDYYERNKEHYAKKDSELEARNRKKEQTDFQGLLTLLQSTEGNSIEESKKEKNSLLALQIATWVVSTLIIIGAAVLCFYALGKSASIGSSSFGGFEILSMTGATGIPVVMGVAGVLLVFIQNKRSFDPNPFRAII